MNPALLISLADYHLLACGLLILTLVTMRLMHQPSHRLAVVGPTFAALGILIVLCLLPGWSVVHLWQQAESSEQPMASVAADRETASFLPEEQPSETRPKVPPTTDISEIPHLETKQVALQPKATKPWHWSSWIAAIYGGGCLVVLTWLCLGWLAARRMLRRATASTQPLLDSLAAVAGKENLPELKISGEVDTAVALGVFRPTILLPGTVSDATPTDRTAILAHEFAHIQNGDLRLLAASRWLLVLLWPQPLYWLLRRQMRLDQETLADAAAAEATDRHGYATQLVRLAREQGNRSRAGTPRLAGAVGLWETRSQLARRIATLLDERLTVFRECSRLWRWACGLLLGAVAMGLSLVTLEPGEVVAEEK